VIDFVVERSSRAGAACRPMCQKLSLETIQLHGCAKPSRPSVHEFIAAAGASENGNPTQVQNSNCAAKQLFLYCARFSELIDMVLLI
jgi:hypothetical protein